MIPAKLFDRVHTSIEFMLTWQGSREARVKAMLQDFDGDNDEEIIGKPCIFYNSRSAYEYPG